MPTKYVRIEGLAINYAHAGATTLPDVPPALDRGVAVLFVHGEGASAPLWSRQMSHFAAAHSPVALDLPAHGRSCGIDGLDSVARMSAFVASFLSAIEAPPAVVVGHSLGGQVALDLAISRPELVRGVVTVGTAAKPEVAEESVVKLRKVVEGKLGQQFDTPFFGASSDFGLMREFWTEMVKTDPRVRLSDILAYRRSDMTGRLKTLKRPALVVQGGADQLCAPGKADELVSGIEGARLALIEGAGNVAHLEKSGEVNQAIDAFLAQL